MVGLVLGIGAAVAASTLYSVGIALQALEAREVSESHGLRLSLARQLVARGRWLAGTAVSVVGWPFQVAALLLAPLVVVQPALATGLLVLLGLGSRMLGEHAGRRDQLAMVAIVVGVAGLAWAAPERSTVHAPALTLGLVLGGLWLLVITPYVLRWFGRSSALIAMVGAGMGFAWGGVATKLVADALARHHLGAAALWAVASTATEGIALLSEMTALQTRPAIQVAPVVFVVQTAVPVAVAPPLLHESLSHTPLSGGALIVSLVILAAGAIVLARSPLLLALIAPKPDQPSDDSDAADSRAAPSDARAESSGREVADRSTLTTKTSPARSGR
jgi:hypothetical protein